MKKNQPSYNAPKDTPMIRKRRLQQRLQEISAKSEQELTTIMKSLEKIKAGFSSNKLS